MWLCQKCHSVLDCSEHQVWSDPKLHQGSCGLCQGPGPCVKCEAPHKQPAASAPRRAPPPPPPSDEQPLVTPVETPKAKSTVVGAIKKVVGRK